MNPSEDRALRRILVALDTSSASLDALSAAAALAARIGAELEGLFVEDVNLLRLAGLPFAVELSLPSGAGRPMARVDMEAELRALAAQAREAMAKAAGPHRVTWSFRVVRGQVTVEVLEAAGGADLLVLGRTARRIGPGPGTTARGAAARAPTSVLILAGGGRLVPRMHVAYDGSAAADRALGLAARLDGGPGTLELIVPAATYSEAEKLAGKAQHRLGWTEPVTWRWAGSARREDVARAASKMGGVMVVGAESAFLRQEGLERMLEEARCPVLLVR